jgi:hypothetical protein
LRRKEKLGSATLTIAILVFFLVFVLRPTLARLFRLVRAGLVVVLGLAMLARLTTLLTLSELTALLALLLHIVSHRNLPPYERRARLSGAFEFVANHNFSCCKDCKGWEGLDLQSDHSQFLA